MFRALLVLATAAIASPALAHPGDHSVLGFAEGLFHGLFEHGHLLIAVLLIAVAAGIVYRRFR